MDSTAILQVKVVSFSGQMCSWQKAGEEGSAKNDTCIVGVASKITDGH